MQIRLGGIVKGVINIPGDNQDVVYLVIAPKCCNECHGEIEIPKGREHDLCREAATIRGLICMQEVIGEDIEVRYKNAVTEIDITNLVAYFDRASSKIK
ncbi:MAG: hypothetical protein PHS75_06205 [Anaerolineaceae bacterium]|nr:hypothetical protein [Anaerolineaceae bacterium]